MSMIFLAGSACECDKCWGIEEKPMSFESKDYCSECGKACGTIYFWYWKEEEKTFLCATCSQTFIHTEDKTKGEANETTR